LPTSLWRFLLLFALVISRIRSAVSLRNYWRVLMERSKKLSPRRLLIDPEKKDQNLYPIQSARITWKLTACYTRRINDPRSYNPITALNWPDLTRVSSVPTRTNLQIVSVEVVCKTFATPSNMPTISPLTPSCSHTTTVRRDLCSRR
jgi:hypothetical protein